MTNIFDQPLDSLPYYDTDLDSHPNLRPQINSQLAVELRSILPPTSTKSSSQPPANLTHLPSPRPLPPTSTLLGAELARAASKKPAPPGQGLDTTRYALPPPPDADAASLEAWEAANRSGLAQLEHQRLRSLNGTLLGQLGANAWRVQNFAMENAVKRVEQEGEEVRAAVEELNRERKRKQEAGGETLTRLEKKWTELVSGNMQLEVGCAVLESEIAQLRARHAELQARLQTA